MKTTVEYEAMGLPADWLNGWLAAIGVTVLVPGVKLSWSEEVVPHAVFRVPEGTSLPGAIAEAMPTLDAVDQMAIVREGPAGKLGQVVRDPQVYAARAEVARERHDTTLECSVTDLAEERDGAPFCRGQFCVGAEGDETLWVRARKCIEAVRHAPDPGAAIAGSLTGGIDGTWLRSTLNGLGFDPRRIANGVESTKTSRWPATDPAVEALAFFGIQLMPVRGRGEKGLPALQKPWRRRGRNTALTYPCWTPELDRWAIDALLDGEPESRALVHARFRVVKYDAPGKQTKAAYFSEAVT